jgi:uncharacterized protein YjbI with pentapeptide repeats
VFQGSNLSEIDLSTAKLTGADLRGARINWVLLYEASLRGLDLRTLKLDREHLLNQNRTETE